MRIRYDHTGWNGVYLDEVLDEIRIIDTSISNACISTSYNTMTNQSTFLSIGIEETQ